MSDNSRLPVTSTLLAALMVSSAVQAEAPSSINNEESDRWRCQASADGGWQCGSVAPADGLGSRFVRPERQTYTELTDTVTTSTAPQKLDWVPRQALTDEQLGETPNYCAGRYVEPAYVTPEQRRLDPSSQPLQGSADSSSTSEGGVTTLSGDVVLTQGYRQIKSDLAILDREANTADFAGKSLYREPGILLTGEDTHVNLSNNEVTINNAEFVGHESHMRGTAKRLVRQGDGVVVVKQGSITRCAPDSNVWSLVGSEVKLDQESGFGSIKHARLHIKDVPVMYIPYMTFPIDDRRKSGFLWPAIGTSDDGIDVAAPYYWNIAPNYDATLTPRYISKRGAMGEAEFRYLHNKNEGVLGGAYLVNDDLFGGEDRWLGVIDHEGQEFNNIRTRVTATAVSDNNYFNDLGTDLNASSQSHLLRLAEAAYSSSHWSITSRVQGYQTIDANITDASKPYDRLPQILATAYYPHEATGLEFNLLTEYSYFDRDNSGLTGLDRAVGHRTRIEPSVSWLYETAYSFVQPKVTYRYAQYQLEDLTTGLNDSPDLAVPVFSLDSGLFFERDTSWVGTPLTQTFEPRLFYLHVPKEDGQQDNPLFDTSELDFSYSQLFREDRFVGGDRVGDAEQLSLGLTTRFVEGDGFEKARASLGQIFYFEDREVTLNGTQARTDRTSESALAGEIMYAWNPYWRLQGDIEWDPDISRTNQSSLYMRYHGDNRHLFNIGYRIRNDNREQLEQTDISLVWPISQQWSFISRWNQDLIHDRIVEAFAGLEYQSCCWAVRVVGRRWINDDDLTSNTNVEEKDAIYIQFILKGLGNIGDSTEQLYRDSIPGYQEL